MSALAIITAGISIWLALAVVVVWCVHRFVSFQQDGDRYTRWDREAAHAEHDASKPTDKHGLN